MTTLERTIEAAKADRYREIAAAERILVSHGDPLSAARICFRSNRHEIAEFEAEDTGAKQGLHTCTVIEPILTRCSAAGWLSAFAN